ncbi:hypothetical protein [Enterococcus casseliflavus]|uniref:hypothetical protein n=1 Tax=Enterococcus casseliflavus TaxID=37734 RepID=UPI0021C788CC|nr:hypothetical protein [Enterococcus casseliflavus]
MLVKDLLKHLQNLDENLPVSLEITTKFVEDDDVPTVSEIDSIEFSIYSVTLKGKDTLVEWD